MQPKAVKCSERLVCSVLCNTAQFCLLQCSSVYYSAVLFITVQCCVLQCIAIFWCVFLQCRAVYYSTVLFSVELCIDVECSVTKPLRRGPDVSVQPVIRKSHSCAKCEDRRESGAYI